MLDLQIPIWAMTACGGWLLGIVSIVALAAWLNWWKRRQMLDALGALGALGALDADVEGESDGMDQR